MNLRRSPKKKQGNDSIKMEDSDIEDMDHLVDIPEQGGDSQPDQKRFKSPGQTN